MGLRNGNQVLFKATNVVSRELDLMLDLIISKCNATVNNNADSTTSTKKSIDCDVSNILHKLSYRHSSVYGRLLVRDVAFFLKRLAQDSGYIVNPILDGNVRPASKRDAFKRRYTSTMSRINSFYCRQSAMKLASIPENDQSDENKNDIREYNNAAKALEMCKRLCVPPSFKEDLTVELQNIGAFDEDRQSGGVVSKDIIQAEFEADYMIAYRIRNKLSTCIYSSDSDMNTLCGPLTLCIRDVYEEKGAKKRTKEDGDNCSPVLVYEITGGSNKLMDEIKELIDNNSPMNQIIYTKAKYPLFEKKIPPYLTSLYAVGIGCDVLPGGVSKVTPLAITRELERIEKTNDVVSSYQELYDKMVEFFLKKDSTKKLTKTDLRTYCQAFMHQPALRMGSKNNPDCWKYVFGKPSSLHPYLRMFAHADGGVVIEVEGNDDNAVMKECKGIENINNAHKFLHCEGSFTCVGCNACFCGTCGYSKVKDRSNDKKRKIYYESMNNDMCVDCYKEQIFLPYSCTLADALSIDEMKQYLRGRNQILSTDIDPHEVQELYELCVIKERRTVDHHAVPFPVHSVQSLSITNNKYGFGDVVDVFDINIGGQFINSPRITNEMIAPVLNLFGTVVRFNEKKGSNKQAIKEEDVLPSILIDFATKSRISTGFRLLKRCLRHAMDPKARPLEHSVAHLFKTTTNDSNGEIGIVLRNKIPASMKDISYDVQIAFTPSKLLATQCQCHAGGSGSANDRVVCVHNLPLIYQLVMLLDDGLAEHLLVELCSRWDDELERVVRCSGKLVEVHRNICCLMQAASVTEEEMNKATQQHTIAEMLNSVFSTGTERCKGSPRPPPTKKLRQIRDITFLSNTTKAKNRKMRSDNRNNDETINSTDNDTHLETSSPSPPDYYNIYTAVKAVGIDPESSDFIGFRLLTLRVKDVLSTKTENNVKQYVRFQKQQYNEVKKDTYGRIKPFRQTQLRTLTSNQSTPTPNPPTNHSTSTLQMPNVQSESMRFPRKVWKRGPRMKCCFPKCEHTERTVNKMQMICSLPRNKPRFDCDRLRNVRRYITKEMERRYTLTACGKKDDKKEYYLCGHHEMKEVTARKTIVRVGKNGKKKPMVIAHKFQCPAGIGMKVSSPPKRKSSCLAEVRANSSLMHSIKNDITNLVSHSNDRNQDTSLVEAVVSNTKLLAKSYDTIDALESKCSLLQQELKESPKKRRNGEAQNKVNATDEKNQVEQEQNNPLPLPVVFVDEMECNAAEVKRRTGFSSLEHLLSYIIVLCDGDFHKMREKHSTLTWFEEWFFYFEFVWGRTIVRWVDATSTYRVNNKTLLAILNKKLKYAITCRSKWPHYASYIEDHTLMKRKWKEKFEGQRIVMWDDTNVDMSYKPSGADEQRLTYSSYYAGNCAKGGVFLQPCGWLGVENLWCGATSDSHYQERTNIFKRQRDFAANDLVNNEIQPFANMMDRGYRVTLAAWRTGKQMVLQPSFTESDKKFSAQETLHTAEVATLRSGNERAVGRAKLAGYIKNGLKQSANPATMDDVWLTWSFQTNFMYKPVL